MAADPAAQVHLPPQNLDTGPPIADSPMADATVDLAADMVPDMTANVTADVPADITAGTDNAVLTGTANTIAEGYNPNLVRVNSQGESIHSSHSSAVEDEYYLTRVPAGIIQDGGQQTQGTIRPGEASNVRSTLQEGVPQWGNSESVLDRYIFPEDTSVPDEIEIQEIEKAGETSALDQPLWEGKAFKDLNDGDYKPLATDRIDWLITRFQGTSENPNTNLIMESDPKEIGGYNWRIRLYPKGNSTNYMSVYLECETFKQSETSAVFDFIDPALPLLADSNHRAQGLRPKRVPAQFCIIMYNPDEPRVHYHKTTNHAFSKQCPDRGFARFGPTHLMNLGQRLPMTRQAMLRNDQLAFVVYIRTYNDQTGCLFRQPSDARWHNFQMTGIHGLSTPWDPRATNLISAVSTWCLLAPFRRVIYGVKFRTDAGETNTCPRPLILAFQRLLYAMRTPNETDKSSVSLDVIRKALAWHGANIGESFDVVQTWETIRNVLEKELRSAPASGRVEKLFTPGGFRARIRSLISNPISSIQESINSYSDDYLFGTHDTWPQILQIEIPRQAFFENTREWKKVNDKVKVNHMLNFKGKKDSQQSYLLYGVIVHNGDLRWGSYAAILRPNGRDWFKLGGAAESSNVLRLTQKQALDAAETSAYLAIYVHSAVAAEHMVSKSPSFNGAPERAFAPSRMVLEYQLRTDIVNSGDEAIRDPYSRVILGTEIPNLPGNPKTDDMQMPDLTLTVFFSYNFIEYTGPGISDFFWRRVKLSDPIKPYKLSIPGTAKISDLKKQLADLVEEKDSSNVSVWPLDFGRGSVCNPHLRSLKKFSDATMTAIVNARGTNFWVHVQSPRDTVPVYGYNTAFSRIYEITADGGIPGSTYVFLKYFDVQAQTLYAVGSAFVPNCLKIETMFDAILHKLSGQDKFEYYEESHTNGCHSLDKKKSMGSNAWLRDGCILIGAPVLSEERENDVLLKGGLVQPTTFIDYLYQQGNRLPVAGESFSRRTHTLSIEAGLPDASYTRDYFGGDFHIGHLSRGCLHGRGKHLYLNGDAYIGMFKMGVRNGEGSMRFANGDTYAGAWFDDRMHGAGRYVQTLTGNTYEGEFKHGRKHGRGVTRWEVCEQDGKVCMICLENEADAAFYDCGHMCACMECAREVKRCPVCRKEGVRAWRIYT